MEEGYGLNLEAIQKLHEEDPHRLLVTVDCGISSVKEAELARDLGPGTGHYRPPHLRRDPARGGLSGASAAAGRTYPFGELCGAGVAFKLAWAICQRLGDGTKASPEIAGVLKSAVGLAAIGTVADVVPLVGETASSCGTV